MKFLDKIFKKEIDLQKEFLISYDDGASPLFKREEDAGYDVYVLFEKDEMYKIINPHETVIFRTGIKTSFPSDYYIKLEERSSTGTIGLSQRAGVIDSGYRGEWMIPITNMNNIPVIVSRLSKEKIDYDGEFIFYSYHRALAQAVIHKAEHKRFIEVNDKTIKSIPSERGIGKLGSSGK